MKILLAPDSFKGSLTAMQAATAMAAGIQKALPSCECVLLPAADGGEGTLQSLVEASKGVFTCVSVEDPLGRPVTARYGSLGTSPVCVIELAESSGLTLLAEEELCPLSASTYGTGQVIRHALDAGFRHFLIGLGGSATNDAGAGILQALGGRLLDKDRIELARGGAALANLQTIDIAWFNSVIAGSTFHVAVDVSNPLTGPAGASVVFGPQKGADRKEVEQLDAALVHFADLIEQHTGVALHNKPGAGAAGGTGGIFQAFFPSVIEPGVDLVLRALRFDDHLQEADLVITGEGRTDRQTFSGKTPYGVALAANKANVPVLLISGMITSDSRPSLETLFNGVRSLTSAKTSSEEAITHARELLETASYESILSYMQNTD